MQADRRELPTAAELAVWREYIETASDLRARLEARLQSESGVSSADYEVMLTLSEAEGRRLRSSELAARMDWQRSRVSHHLGRMEQRGLIRREPCADDSRGAEVVLTSEGSMAFRRASVPHLRAVRELFLDAFEPEQLDDIASTAAALRRHLGSAARR
ncbi:MarR family transcriptional regulator [Agromyces sp. MMS17-SY077]|uniref:MarR family transcriptional regulator n=1 Tax=Agromyces seonyuensis TaxID=2662446 RepID=A0A6I4NVY9_9MICO|nr:MarR family transcriptional regulator [Agromyces seonyuensis]